MLKVWLLSVRRRENDPPDHFLTLLHFEFVSSFNNDSVLTHQTADPPVPHFDANFFQLFGHSWAAIAAQTQTRLFLDVGQNNHVHVLSAAGRTAVEGAQAAWADIHHQAHPVDGESAPMFFDKPEPHGVGHLLGPMAFMPSIAREELGGFF